MVNKAGSVHAQAVYPSPVYIILMFVYGLRIDRIVGDKRLGNPKLRMQRGIQELVVCLSIVLCPARELFTHEFGDVTTTDDGLQNIGLRSALRTFQLGSLSCYTSVTRSKMR
jgi:hypothetical protein